MSTDIRHADRTEIDEAVAATTFVDVLRRNAAGGRDLGPWRRIGRMHILGEENLEVPMHAQKGDRLVIRGHHVGDLDRDAEILKVGEHGGPPYLVRWSDDGHEGLIFPGSDALIRHPEGRKRRAMVS